MVQNQLQGAVQMAASLDLDRDHIGSRLGEGGDELVRILDHQVAVERQIGNGPDRFDDRRAEGDVGDEMAVHHVHVDNGAATGCGSADLISKMREVCGQDRKCEFNH